MVFVYLWLAVLIGFGLGYWAKTRLTVNDYYQNELKEYKRYAKWEQ